MTTEINPGVAGAGANEKTSDELGDGFSLANITQPSDRPPAHGTAYNRVLDRLHEIGKRYRDLGSYAQAQCPSHDDQDPSLTIYRKPGRIKIVCFAGCNDQLDILPALGLTLPDLWDEPRTRRDRNLSPGPRIQARIQARRNMDLVQRAVDDLLHLPDLGERITRSIIWHDNAQRLSGDHDE